MKAARLSLLFVFAVLAAYVISYLALDKWGVSPRTIRVDALLGVGFLGASLGVRTIFSGSDRR